MDIKVMFKATALALALGGMGLSGSALAADVTLNITGNVKASPCKLDLGGSATKEVKLNGGKNIEAAAMANPDTYTDDEEFSLKLVGCPDATTSVTATFAGEPSTENNDLYKNQAAMGAESVQIELRNQKGDNLGNNKTMNAVVNAAGEATFDLKARAYTSQGGVKPGSISTAVQVGFVYH